VIVLDVSSVRDTKGTSGVAGCRTACSAYDHSHENTCGLALGIGDLISYRGSGKGCAAIADKVELIVTEYAGWFIDIHVGNALISA